MLPDSELEIQYMTWNDVDDRLSSGYRTAVFSVGATEQHGPHLPIATDTLLGIHIARAVAAELGDALVAPTIRPGYSPHHMDFPGTITLRQSTLSGLIVDYCTSLAAHGFELLVVISSHGGNNPIIKMAVQEAQSAIGERAIVIPITDLTGYYETDDDRREEGYHATRTETSCILSLTPELVQMERAQDWVNPISAEIKDVGALLGLRGTRHFSEQGTLGKPSSADAGLGRDVLRRMARGVAEQVRLIVRHAT
jgi:creatinine amidohydrolase